MSSNFAVPKIDLDSCPIKGSRLRFPLPLMCVDSGISLYTVSRVSFNLAEVSARTVLMRPPGGGGGVCAPLIPENNALISSSPCK